MPKKIFPEKKNFEIPSIPFQLSTVASYDPLTDMYKLEAFYPANVIEPLLEADTHIQITIPSSEIRARKDALIRHLITDAASQKQSDSR